MPEPSENHPLISVVIPCFNHGNYLPEAFASVWQQDYPAVEIVLVDDGSSDNTREVARRFSTVKYFYQENQGPSAARNNGIAHSTGQYVVFLDADDWLLPGALTYNAWQLQQNPTLAFVSGGHTKEQSDTGAMTNDSQEVTVDHYQKLLHGNYIGMLATVMFQRWAFNETGFDSALRGCEDYDLFLRIARSHPVAHHTRLIATYRRHATNKTANIPFMLSTALQVLRRQQPLLRTAAEQLAWVQGLENWQDYYCRVLYQKLRLAENLPGRAEIATLLRHRPFQTVRHALQPQLTMLRRLIKKYTPALGVKMLYQAGIVKTYVPPVGQVVMGDFRRLKPFSNDFGYDRGLPIDRYYIENFLRREAECIRGRVLEIGDNDYTMRFGQGITQSDILHVDVNNSRATFIGDLSNAAHIPDNLFDCLILTQTLHLIYDYQNALATCHRILKPGGALLLTVPGITPIDRGEWKETWYWSFTDSALKRLITDVFPAGQLTIGSFGNVFVASCFLYGLSRAEVTDEQLDNYDPQFQVINTVKAIKA